VAGIHLIETNRPDLVENHDSNQRYESIDEIAVCAAAALPAASTLRASAISRASRLRSYACAREMLKSPRLRMRLADSNCNENR